MQKFFCIFVDFSELSHLSRLFPVVEIVKSTDKRHTDTQTVTSILVLTTNHYENKEKFNAMPSFNVLPVSLWQLQFSLN